MTPAEGDVLDRCAAELGVSRSEVLRRGLRAIGDPAGASPGGGTTDEWLTPASLSPGAPPPSLPVAPLEQLLNELEQDRGMHTIWYGVTAMPCVSCWPASPSSR